MEPDEDPAYYRAVTSFASGATREASDEKLDYEGFLSPIVLERFGQYMHKHRVQADGSLRSSDNWQQGIPRKAYLKSLLRHVFELWRHQRGFELEPKTERDPQNLEDVLCAIMFNAMGLLHEVLVGRDAE